MTHFMFGGFPQGVPGNDAFTKILLHMDGSNGGTTFTDVNAGGSAHTWTPTNSVTSSASLKFGPTSLKTTSGFIRTPNSSDFILGASDFCVDFWLNGNGTSGVANLCGQIDASGTNGSISVGVARSSGNLILASAWLNASNYTSVVGSTTVTDSVWRHIAFVRSSNNLRLYINGTQEGLTTALSSTIPNQTSSWSVGSTGDLNTSTSVYIDEFRLSVGTPRWTANFTPPTAQYI